MTVFQTAVCPQADAPPPLNETGELVLYPHATRHASFISLRADAEVNDSESDAPEPDGEEEDSMPPNLEEFIPEEQLPDIIDVYIDKEFLSAAQGYGFSKLSTAQLERPIKFVRQYVRCRDVDKGMFNTPS